MNIKIPDSWLRDYIKTKAEPKDIAKALSLHAFSVEKMERWGDEDTIYEIEVTPNRGDALSVVGIAREANAALPQIGIKSEWVGKGYKKGKDKDISLPKIELKLDVVIKDKSLVPQFSAIVLDNVSIRQSDKRIQSRLEKVGIRVLDNVVDVTNYFMIDKGQPMHSFDYDKILGSKMTVRGSRAKESITTLDGVKRILPEGVIVIEDGKGRLIDLCGIMGAQNSEVDQNTRRVLLFVQIYDPVRIRKASMALGHRTDAAMRFEKGVDPKGVVPSLWEAVEILSKEANAKVASQLIDIINKPYKAKKVTFDIEKIQKIAGIELDKDKTIGNLKRLGFTPNEGKDSVSIPSWRCNDIETTEDLAEEVIRLYGYYNLPNTPLTQEIPPRRTEKVFLWEKKAKEYLKHQGFFESYNTSATTEELAGEGALKLANPLSKEIAYLRTSLIPQLKEVIKQNKGYSNTVKLFELAAVYLPNKKDLPNQPHQLALVTKGISYEKLKGIVEGLLVELGVVGTEKIVISNPGNEIFATEINFETIAKNATNKKAFTPISKYASVKQDLTLILPKEISYYQVEKTIKKADKRVEKIAYQSTYQNTITISVELLDRTKQLDATAASQIRQKILDSLQKNLKVSLKN